MNEEQQRYLAEGLRHRARFYSGDDPDRGDDELTLALAWFAAWWRDRADRAAARNADFRTPDFFDG